MLNMCLGKMKLLVIRRLKISLEMAQVNLDWTDNGVTEQRANFLFTRPQYRTYCVICFFNKRCGLQEMEH